MPAQSSADILLKPEMFFEAAHNLLVTTERVSFSATCQGVHLEIQLPRTQEEMTWAGTRAPDIGNAPLPAEEKPGCWHIYQKTLTLGVSGGRLQAANLQSMLTTPFPASMDHLEGLEAAADVLRVFQKDFLCAFSMATLQSHLCSTPDMLNVLFSACHVSRHFLTSRARRAGIDRKTDWQPDFTVTSVDNLGLLPSSSATKRLFAILLTTLDPAGAEFNRQPHLDPLRQKPWIDQTGPLIDVGYHCRPAETSSGHETMRHAKRLRSFLRDHHLSAGLSVLEIDDLLEEVVKDAAAALADAVPTKEWSRI